MIISVIIFIIGAICICAGPGTASGILPFKRRKMTKRQKAERFRKLLTDVSFAANSSGF